VTFTDNDGVLNMKNGKISNVDRIQMEDGLLINNNAITTTGSYIEIEQARFNGTGMNIDTINAVTGDNVTIEGSLFTDSTAEGNATITTDRIHTDQIRSRNGSNGVITFHNNRLTNVGIAKEPTDVVTLEFLDNHRDQALQRLKPKKAVDVASTKAYLEVAKIKSINWDPNEMRTLHTRNRQLVRRNISHDQWVY
jgi:hypothetical protein